MEFYTISQIPQKKIQEFDSNNSENSIQEFEEWEEIKFPKNQVSQSDKKVKNNNQREKLYQNQSKQSVIFKKQKKKDSNHQEDEDDENENKDLDQKQLKFNKSQSALLEKNDDDDVGLSRQQIYNKLDYIQENLEQKDQQKNQNQQIQNSNNINNQTICHHKSEENGHHYQFMNDTQNQFNSQNQNLTQTQFQDTDESPIKYNNIRNKSLDNNKSTAQSNYGQSPLKKKKIVKYKKFQKSQEIFKKFPEKIKKHNDVLLELEKYYFKKNEQPYLKALQKEQKEQSLKFMQFQQIDDEELFLDQQEIGLIKDEENQEKQKILQEVKNEKKKEKLLNNNNNFYQNQKHFSSSSSSSSMSSFEKQQIRDDQPKLIWKQFITTLKKSLSQVKHTQTSLQNNVSQNDKNMEKSDGQQIENTFKNRNQFIEDEDSNNNDNEDYQNYNKIRNYYENQEDAQQFDLSNQELVSIKRFQSTKDKYPNLNKINLKKIESIEVVPQKKESNSSKKARSPQMSRRNRKQTTQLVITNQFKKNKKVNNLQRRHTINFNEIIRKNIPGQRRKISDESNNSKDVKDANSVTKKQDEIIEFRPKHRELYLYEYEKRLQNKSILNRINYVFGDNKKEKDLNAEWIVTRVYYFGTRQYIQFRLNKKEEQQRTVQDLISYIISIYMQDPKTDKSQMRFPTCPQYYQILQGGEEEEHIPDLVQAQTTLNTQVNALDFGEFSQFSNKYQHKDIISLFSSEINSIKGKGSQKNLKYALIEPEIYAHSSYTYDYHFEIKSLDPSNKMMIGICDLETISKNNYNFDYKSKGAYLVSADGFVYSCHEKLINNKKQNILRFEEGNKIILKINPQLNSITYINETLKLSYQQKVDKHSLQFQLHVCCLVSSSQDKIQLLSVESECPYLQQPTLILMEDHNQLNNQKYHLQNGSYTLRSSQNFNNRCSDSNSEFLVFENINNILIKDNKAQQLKKMQRKQSVDIDDPVRVPIKIKVIESTFEYYSTILILEDNIQVIQLYQVLAQKSSNEKINKTNCYFSYLQETQYAKKETINNIQVLKDLDIDSVIYCHFRDFSHDQTFQESGIQDEEFQGQTQKKENFEGQDWSSDDDGGNKDQLYYNNSSGNFTQQGYNNQFLSQGDIQFQQMQFSPNKILNLNQIIRSSQKLTFKESLLLKNQNSLLNQNYLEDEDYYQLQMFRSIIKELQNTNIFDYDEYQNENLESYEEFEFQRILIKNHDQTIKEDRIIGVDGTQIYNKLPKQNGILHSIKQFFRPNLKTKTPYVQFEDIHNIRIDNHDRRIIFLDIKQEQARLKTWKLLAQDSQQSCKFYIKVFLLKQMFEMEE